VLLEALISACRADLRLALAGHSMSAKALRKSMKTQLSKYFAQRLLKSLKIFSVKKLSTDSPIFPANSVTRQFGRTQVALINM
jgi:hypothetical protein